MRRRRNTPYLIGFLTVWLCFGVVGFLFGYYYSPDQGGSEPLNFVENPSGSEENNLVDDPNSSNPQTDKNINDRPTSSSDLVVSEETKIIFRSLYEQCQNSKDIVMEKPLDEMLGLNERKFKEYLATSSFKDWQMVRFSGDEIVLFERKNQICPDHFWVSELDGYIAVFQFNEVGQKILVEKTTIPISVLPKVDQEKLKEGVLLPNREEVNKLLEDYIG